MEKVSLTGPTEGVQLGNPVTITCNAENHKDGVCDFFANVTGVTLKRPDGTTKELSKDGVESVFDEIGYTVNGNKLTLGKDLFSTAGNYSVTIRAGHGYGTQTVNFAITAKEVTPPVTDDTAAPTVNEVTSVKEWGTSYYRVSFDGMDKGALKDYLNAINSVTVGTAEYAKSGYLSTNAYKLFATDTTQSAYDYDRLDLTSNGFATDAITEVVIKATGYTDLTFKVKNGALVTGEDSTKLSPPAFSSAEKVTPFFGDNYTRISFVGDENIIATYLALIETNRVTVNRETIEKTSSFWQSEKKFKLSNDSAYGGENIYLDITEDSFSTSGNSTVVISVDGYNDLTFTINAQGKLVTE